MATAYVVIGGIGIEIVATVLIGLVMIKIQKFGFNIFSRILFA